MVGFVLGATPFVGQTKLDRAVCGVRSNVRHTPRRNVTMQKKEEKVRHGSQYHLILLFMSVTLNWSKDTRTLQ